MRDVGEAVGGTGSSGEADPWAGLPAGALLRGCKLVIWDLDETLWDGVLSEGGITRRPPAEEAVAALGRSGILNSIASNNDPSEAQAALAELGLWEHFVFPSIGWGSKADLVSEVLAHTHLRTASTLLVDDSPRQRELVRAATGVAGVHPLTLLKLCSAGLPLLDPEYARREQYRHLERRDDAWRRAPMDAAEFLRRSNIHVELRDPRDCVERVVLLSRRAHQLNYTKRELSHDDVLAAAGSEGVRAAAVSVSDRFGDYGIAGYFALDENAHELRDFVFSCRVHGMGVQRHLYTCLGSPTLSIAAPVADDPTAEPGTVDWITVSVAGDERGGGRTRRTPGDPSRILLKGGCDLELTSDFAVAAGLAPPSLELLAVEQGVQRYGHSGLTVLAAIAAGGFGELLARVPWTRGNQTTLYSGDHDLAVLSLWVDYACLSYRHRTQPLRIPSFVDLGDADEATWAHWWGHSRRDRRWFLANFEMRPPLTPDEVFSYLELLRASVPSRTRLAVVNAPECQVDWTYRWGQRQSSRHREVNAAVDQAVDDLGFGLIDLRRLVSRSEDLAQDDQMLTHYARHVYVGIADQIAGLVAMAS